MWLEKLSNENPETSPIMVLTDWRRRPSDNGDEDVAHKHLCLFIQLISYQGFVKLSVSLQRLDVKLKQLDPELLLYPSTVQAQGPTRSQQSCKTVANHARCLQKAESSVLSINSKQFTCRRRSKISGNGGDDDSELGRETQD